MNEQENKENLKENKAETIADAKDGTRSRRWGRWLAGAVIVPVLGAMALGAAYFNYPLTFANDAESVDVVIPRGASARRVAQLTNRSGIAVPQDVLVAALRLTDAVKTIHTGRYRFERGVTLSELVDKYRTAAVEETTLTVADGMTQWQLRALVKAQADLTNETVALSDKELLALIGAPYAHLEGLFAPDTYHFKSGVSDVTVFKMAYKRQMELLDAVWKTRPETTVLRTPYEALILASIIEKETSQESDRTLVSSVFHNRLRIRMPLQTDPTVIYGLGETFDGNLRRRDLRAPGIYNTYINYGLPPTPISMPTKASIEAAVHPAKTTYLYFVARGDGTTHFSSTLTEHNRAVNKYQRGK